MDKLLKLRMELVDSKKYLSILDVALLSGYSISTIRRRIDEGKLKAIQNVPKGKLLFKKSNVEQWLEN
tara:strand:+ start:1033 stop:1236 length:204 start_codon:yes stop_codon:yes gene_type:complete